MLYSNYYISYIFIISVCLCRYTISILHDISILSYIHTI
uniref:Uncharacterized protein n=1 Tax=Myoviridae sp. ctdNl2 TaxID=2825140 RepID=A0A8S5QGP7_9CAUD|nr:MAG TPA: hypothetical protein [Myoviridae sp. ctdNl2]